jgi:hypothetical protein
MPILQVDLREGFDGDLVVVRVDGREAYRQDGVRTNYSVGLADRVGIEVPRGTVRVELVLPERGLSAAIAHEAIGPATLAFALSPSGELTGRHIERPLDL